MDVRDRMKEILSKALARITDEHGQLIDPQLLPPEQEAAADDVWIAWALVSCAGAGPFEEQKARIEEMAAEREGRFGNVRAMLQRFGVGVQVGPLERQVEVLGEQRDRLRQIGGVGADLIERLTKERDAARAGIRIVFDGIEAGHLDLVHEPVRIQKGDHHHETACPEDDTCECPCRVIMLKVQLAGAEPGSSEALSALEGLLQAGALHVSKVEVQSDDPDRLAFGMIAGHEVQWMGPAAVKVASENPEMLAPAEVATTIDTELRPVFVTLRAEQRGKHGTHRAPIELPGSELQAATVKCTHEDLGDPGFRAWLEFELATRFPEGADSLIKLELVP